MSECWMGRKELKFSSPSLDWLGIYDFENIFMIYQLFSPIYLIVGRPLDDIVGKWMQ